MGQGQYGSMIRWWGIVVVGAAAALLFAWLGRLAGVPLAVLLYVGASVAALAWTVVLVTMPWNLYFGARRVVAEMAGSRRRGIAVEPEDDAEAGRIARRMLGFALGGHVGTAAATAAVAYVSATPVVYYVAAAFLLTSVIRPAAAYFAHLRERIAALATESRYPRLDVVTLRRDVTDLTDAVKAVRTQLSQGQLAATNDLRHAESVLAGDIAHLREQVTSDLTRLEDAQAVDRATARSRDEELKGRIEQMVRRIEATLDGISDHQELLTGIRALVRMMRADSA
jgi:hypothetical protein